MRVPLTVDLSLRVSSQHRRTEDDGAIHLVDLALHYIEDNTDPQPWDLKIYFYEAED
jgi:hypothetical protein